VNSANNAKHNQMKPRLRKRTDRAWFSHLYYIRTGNGASVFLQPGAGMGPESVNMLWNVNKFQPTGLIFQPGAHPHGMRNKKLSWCWQRARRVC